MKLSSLIIAVACSALTTAAFSQCPPHKTPLSSPQVTFVSSTKNSITVQVTGANGFGAPAGFVLQWQKASVLDGPDGIAGTGDDVDVWCDKSYNALTAGGSTTVIIAPDITLNEDCFLLTCSTEYRFRAFAKGNNLYCVSGKSIPITSFTADCEEVCVYGFGFWKTHSNLWPVTELTIGSIQYNQSALLDILRSRVQGNGLISLAHQLIAAELNKANGADVSSIVNALADAHQLISTTDAIPPSGSGFLAPSMTSALTEALDIFNNDGHCPDVD